MNKSAHLNRWRLLLGNTESLGSITEGKYNSDGDDTSQDGSESDLQDIAGILDYLFAGKTAPSQSNSSRSAGQESSAFNVPEWINYVDRLFPQQAKKVLESELIQRKGIAAILKDPALLEKIEPSIELVTTLLTFKDQLSDETRVAARKVIDNVVQELKQKIKLQVEPALMGAIRKDRHSSRKVLRNLDLKTTLRRNLKNWDADRQQLIIDQTFFYAAEKNARPWHIILGIDQSGSMGSSVVFSAIMGSIFYELPSVSTSLFVFDTEIVDLTADIKDPVDVLFNVQLGGGTTINKATSYAQQLVRDSRRTIFILITDFYEGGDSQRLVKDVSAMHQAGVRQIGLAALSYDAKPEYDREMATKLRKSGMDILECTPEKLAECIVQVIR